MKLAFDRLDTRGLTVDLSGREGDTVAIASTTNLRGSLVTGDGAVSVPDAAADQIALAALRLTLGSLALAAPSGATLDDVVVTLEQEGDSLALEVTASALEAPDFTLLVGGVALRARVTLGGVRLVVRGGEGSIAADSADLGAFALRIDDANVQAHALQGTSVTVGWGGAHGFRLEAASLGAPALAVGLPGTKLAADRVALSALSVSGSNVTVGRAELASAQVDRDLTRSSGGDDAAREDRATSDVPIFDWRVLDTLSGQLDVDVEVDLTVPILGRRRATHALRVAIAGGSIDFRALEANLSALEDAVLDFSVREGALVLERVNPLFPVRGHGKPILAWPLGADDLALAAANRARLAVLPEVTVVGKDEAPSDAAPSKSPVALRLLKLVALRAQLALEAVAGDVGGSLRPKRLGSIAIEGDLAYDPGAAAAPGALRAEVAELDASIVGLALGAKTTLDVERLVIASVAPMAITFADAIPTSIGLEASGVVVERVSVKG